MTEIKTILKSWALTSIVAKWVLIGAVVGTGAYVIAGPGLHVEISINKGGAINGK